MNFIVYVLCWYVVVFGVVLMQRAWNRRSAGKPARPQEPIVGLKEGETIVGIVDRPDAIQFYIGTNVMDEKSYD